MTDDELLDKVFDFTDRWSKPLIAGIGGYLLSAFVIAWNVTDWVIASARDNLGALIAFSVGGILTGAVLASLFWRRIVKRALKAKDDAVTNAISSGLDGVDGFERVDDLGSLVEKARGLSSLNGQLATQVANRDARIAELEQRPTQEAVDNLKKGYAEAIAARDAEIERLRSPVEAVRRAISSLPVNELAMVGTLRNGPLKTSGFVEILSHLASLGIAEKLKAPGVFTPTWGLTSSAIDALGKDERLSKSAADAAADGVRDLEAERYISSIISKLPEEQLGAVFIMHERGFFDYRAVDNDLWGYERDQGADDLRGLESAGIAEYRTLGDGMRRWTLTERAARAIDDDPTLVEEGRRYFETVTKGGGS